ncbi:DUF6591 domain-containing protein [Bacillus marasmi]|uniref:DUF6591 domain-containing protein n=1 Tax=Bacillus marasmi TaxID=1926279 RepID=UPI0011CC7BDB|nr:DUF6591 domain-containing protein [Bacillus marasmi]
MKRKNRFLVILLIIFGAIIIGGCGPEDIVEKATDGAVDVDKDGNIEIKGEDGQGEMKIGEAKWDKSKMYGLPEPKATLDSYISTEESTSYTFSDMKEKDAKAYIKKIKKEGYTFNFVTMDEYHYTGTNKEGIIISFTYDKESKSGMISATKGEVPQGDNGGTVFEGEIAKWESDKIGGLPDPGVAITSFASSGAEATYTFEKLDDYKAYAEKIKELGYTEEASEVESVDGYFYSAKNSSGDSIFFNVMSDSCSVVFTKASE